MRKLHIVLINFYLVLLIGCSTISTSVSSISSDDAMQNNKIYLMPSDAKIDITDLLFIEFSKDVKLALETNGFIVVNDITQSDQIAFLTYGISDPKTQIVSIPQFGPTNISSANTTGQIYSSGNTATYTGTTTYNYNYGITGIANRAETYYTRVIIITSYDKAAYDQEKKVIQKWQTTLVSNGESNDLRTVFPYMIYSAEKYIGKNTSKAITVKVITLDKKAEKYTRN